MNAKRNKNHEIDRIHHRRVVQDQKADRSDEHHVRDHVRDVNEMIVAIEDDIGQNEATIGRAAEVTAEEMIDEIEMTIEIAAVEIGRGIETDARDQNRSRDHNE